MKKGIFCISLDTELLWGRHDRPYQQFIPRTQKEREIIRTILSWCKKNKIPITWAIVGHLFLRSCSKVHNVKHPEIIRSVKTEEGRDWFADDPCTSDKQDPSWYAPDIIKEIQNTQMQEIGLHSFSHVSFGSVLCTRETAESEIVASLKAASMYKIKFSSFVFPYNLIGYLDILKKYKFTSYRGIQQNIPILRGFFHHMFMALDFFLPTVPSIVTASLENGLVNIPASFYFPSSRGKRKYIPKGMRFAKARKGIDAAIKQGKIFHLWTHPTDLADNTENLLEELHKIFMYAVAMQKKGLLEIKTMEEIAKEMLHKN